MRSQPPPQLWAVASLLLRYPSGELLERDGELAAVVAGFRPAGLRDPLLGFLDHRRDTAPIALEQEYVETFDLRRRCTLNVGYYLYGDTRRRGVALLRLKRMYAAAGMVLESSELPDQLPVMLEFAATTEAVYGGRVLAEHRVGIELLRRALHGGGCAHAGVLDAVCAALPRLGPGEASAVARLAAEGPPDERVGLEPFAPPEVMPLEVRT